MRPGRHQIGQLPGDNRSITLVPGEGYVGRVGWQMPRLNRTAKPAAWSFK